MPSIHRTFLVVSENRPIILRLKWLLPHRVRPRHPARPLVVTHLVPILRFDLHIVVEKCGPRGQRCLYQTSPSHPVIVLDQAPHSGCVEINRALYFGHLHAFRPSSSSSLLGECPITRKLPNQCLRSAILTLLPKGGGFLTSNRANCGYRM